MKRKAQRGNSLLEFTLVGIPMIFVLISIFDMSRLVWSYHTLTAAVADAARYAIVHGKNCGTAPNDCAVSVAQVAQRLKSSGVGLPASDVNVSLTSVGGTTTCVLATCLTNHTTWPPAPSNEPGMAIEISATYPILSMTSMLWPGSRSVGPFGRVPLSASSRESIQF